MVRYAGPKPGEEAEEAEDFEDDDEEDDPWPSHLPVDIDPRVLIAKLPGYDKGAYLIDWMNVT